jgi:hypothetical protein
MKPLLLVLISALVSFATLATPPQVTFRDSYVRYVSEHDLFRLLQQKFPNGGWNSLSDCNALSGSNGTAIGVPDPVSGELTYPGPSESFAGWYFKCLMAGVTNEMNHAASTPNGWIPFIGPATLQKKSRAPTASSPQPVLWNSFDSDVKRQIIGNLINIYIGPNIVKDERTLLDQLMAATADKSLSTSDAIKQLVQLIASQDDFLSY